MNPVTMPEWVRNQMMDGLSKLMLLRLQGAPPADAVKGVAEVWCEALTPHTWAFTEELDAQRLPQAFDLLIQQADRWVQPAQLIRLIPPRPAPQIAGLLTYQRPPLTDKQRAAHKQNIQRLLSHLAKAKKIF